MLSPPRECVISCDKAGTLTCGSSTVTYANCEGSGGQDKLCNCQGTVCELACSGKGFCSATDVLNLCESTAECECSEVL
jgi:hypothetical protein